MFLFFHSLACFCFCCCCCFCFWIHLGLLSALDVSRSGLGACWDPMVMNWCCYLKRGLLTAKPLNAVTRTRDCFSMDHLLLNLFAWLWLWFDLVSGRGCSRGRLWKWLEGLAAAPHAVQHDSQFASHRYDGAFLASLASARGQLQAPAAQCRVGTEAA